MAKAAQQGAEAVAQVEIERRKSDRAELVVRVALGPRHGATSAVIPTFVTFAALG